MNKPENVKLEVYKFKLNPRKTYKGTVSFRDLFIKQTGSANGVSNVDLFKDYFNFFITTLDTEYKIVKNKAFTLIGGNTDTGFSATSQIVYGVLEGGPLGEGKTRRTAADKTDTNALDGNVINDQYFFYLYTPLNSANGYLMFQTYHQDNIRHEFFSTILNEVFSIKNEYNMPNYEPVMPQNIKEEFKSGAKIQELKFSENMLSTQIASSVGFQSINESYKIEVKITPVRGNVGLSLKDILIPGFVTKAFNNVKLGDFSSKKVVLQKGTNKSNKRVTFEMDGTGDIMPRIYLKDRISINSAGIPNFQELKAYCDTVLATLIDEHPTVTEI